ncbi:MAG: VWA domain-containing protein [Caldilineaceae bacterium]|nr:VWA domain-containing protein [Caldilineaceae bacterium]MCB0145049.1 VWA domain-containing protein [Caldilineaceae bacterium]
MTFIWPFMLYSLLLLPLCALPYLRGQRRRQAMTANLGALGLTQDARGRGLGRWRHLPMTFFMLGMALLLLALARPQTELNLPRVEGTVILAFDVSASMAADDLEPTRMEAAKLAAEAFVRQQPRSVRIGVVSFSDGGLVVQTPTNEQIAILDTINRLAPQSGTSLGQGISASLNMIFEDSNPRPANANRNEPAPTPLPSGSFKSAIIVLLTDGENTEEPDPLAMAEMAADYGVRVYAIGLGSPAGAVLEIDGFSVFTQLNEEVLRQIADITSGAYYNAADEEDLVAIYDDLGKQLVVRGEETEVTALFAGGGVLFFLIGGIFSLLWFGRFP